MAKMREGQCKRTRKGRTYCKINGRVRFVSGSRRVGNAPSSPYHHKTESPGAVGRHRLSGTIANLGDPVAVSLKALSGFVSGVKNCLTVVTPTGVKSVCRSASNAVKRRRKTMSVSGHRKTRRRKRTR